MRVLLALGGNAMTSAEGRTRPADQIAAAEVARAAVAGLMEHDHEVAVTHGNSPQVGNLLVRNELAAGVVPLPSHSSGAARRPRLRLAVGFAKVADVHYVQTKTPQMTVHTIRDAKSRSKTVWTEHTHESMDLSNGCTALGIAVALGEIEEAIRSAASSCPIAPAPATSTAAWSTSSSSARSPRNGQVRGRRNAMLDDSDVHCPRSSTSAELLRPRRPGGCRWIVMGCGP